MATEERFDEQYYQSNGQLGDRPALRFYARLVRRYVGGGPYLDFGCGTGHLLRHLSRISAAGPASGFEVSPYSVAQARRIAPESTIYERADDIPDAAFGGGTAIHVFEHLDQPVLESALGTLGRALRPQGRMLVVVPDPAGRARAVSGEAWLGFSDPTHINLKPAAEWRALFPEHGFSVVREASDGMWNVPYGRLPKYLEALRYSLPALAQFVSGQLFLPPGCGESAIFVLERRAP